MKSKLDKESDVEINKLLAAFVESIRNPKPPSEWSEEAKRIDLVQEIILESFALGNYKFSSVLALAKIKLGSKLPDYLKDFKGVYGAISVVISEDMFNEMDDSKAVRAFKLDKPNE